MEANWNYGNNSDIYIEWKRRRKNDGKSNAKGLETKYGMKVFNLKFGYLETSFSLGILDF